VNLRRLFASLLALMRKRRLDLELEDEIRAHVRQAKRDPVERGLSREQAYRKPRRGF